MYFISHNNSSKCYTNTEITHLQCPLFVPRAVIIRLAATASQPPIAARPWPWRHRARWNGKSATDGWERWMALSSKVHPNSSWSGSSSSSSSSKEKVVVEICEVFSLVLEYRSISDSINVVVIIVLNFSRIFGCK